MTTTQAGDDAWLEEIPSRLTAMIDLICFPGAGAGASVFRPWRDRLPAFVTLLACQLPGHESRIEEPPTESLSQAADAVARTYLRRRPRKRPVVLFGHSMGGALAFETARRLVDMGRIPVALLISASEPPRGNRCAPVERRELERLLLAYDPENAAVISDPELSRSLMPILEADIRLLRSEGPVRGEALLEVPLWLFYGSEDPVVPGDAVARWAEHVTGKVTTMEIPGGHQFAFKESRDELLSTLTRILRDAVRHS